VRRGYRFTKEVAMALYHFDIEDNGKIYHDDQGTECATFADVKREASTALAEIMKDAIPDGDHRKMSIRVHDEAGRLVLHVAMNFSVESEHPPGSGSSSSNDHHA
jgi:hypothetical protein